ARRRGPVAGGIPRRLDHRCAQGSRDADHRGARADPARRLLRLHRVSLALGRRRYEHRDPHLSRARQRRVLPSRRRHRGGFRSRAGIPRDARQGPRTHRRPRPMILLIDNYDSFVYNLARYVRELGEETVVRRHDATSHEEIERLGPSHIIISPGPCSPGEAGISTDVVRRFGSTTPILGVCLGHQCIGAAYGAGIVRAGRPMHGKASRIRHAGRGIFAGLPNPFRAARYHSPFAPMGVEWGEQEIVIKPFLETTTFKNLRDTGAAVVNLTDDVMLFAQGAIATVQFPAVPATAVRGVVLEAACSWREVKVHSLDA